MTRKKCCTTAFSGCVLRCGEQARIKIGKRRSLEDHVWYAVVRGVGPGGIDVSKAMIDNSGQRKGASVITPDRCSGTTQGNRG